MPELNHLTGRSERDKMLAGDLYDPADADLHAGRLRARALCRELANADPHDAARTRQIATALLGRPVDAVLTPPFFCDYGVNIELGTQVYFNVNCVVLDVAPVRIGSHTLMGSAVQIYTAMHPMDAAERRRGLESGLPVVIGADVWIGGGAIVCPGVRIGDGTIVGAGSVVTRDLPAGVFAAGNPCRVIRPL